MKCPHCNYVSFEYLDTCRKCSKDLTAHKNQFGIDFMEPVSLGVLTFVEGRAAASAAVGDMLDVGGARDAGIFIDEERSTEDLSTALSHEDEIKIDFGEPAGAATQEAAEEIGLDLNAGMDEIASDSGFTLNIGEDIESGGGLEISLEEPETKAGPAVEEIGISLGEEPSEEEGGQIVMKDLDISLEEETGGPIVIGETKPKDRGMELDVEEIGGLEIQLEEPSSEQPTVKIAKEDAKKAVAKSEDDFADIEISLDDSDLFGEKKKGEDKGLDLDLGDLDLKIGEDDLGLKF